ncbi:hypothetical protein B0J14DRAFT_568469 [Halenospora varia]|nr:hypothetical protein B0J14DRAFT_568469 [Halenospora varia]
MSILEGRDSIEGILEIIESPWFNLLSLPSLEQLLLYAFESTTLTEHERIPEMFLNRTVQSGALKPRFSMEGGPPARRGGCTSRAALSPRYPSKFSRLRVPADTGVLSRDDVQIDDAIASRIHFKLKYENLNREQRTNIWRHFLEKAVTPQGAPIYSRDDFDSWVRKKRNGPEEDGTSQRLLLENGRILHRDISDVGSLSIALLPFDFALLPAPARLLLVNFAALPEAAALDAQNQSPVVTTFC